MRTRLLPLALASCILWGACVTDEIEEADRPLLVTLADVKDYGFELDHLAALEVFRRSRYLDGSLEVEYEFETPEGASEVLFISTTAGFEKSVTDAIQSFRLERGGIGIGAKVGGGSIQEKKGFYSWGDESVFGDILGDHGPGGNIFGARLGKKTYWLMIAGLHFDDRAEWEQFIKPKLEYLTTYEP
jgi:hypothetical protein